MPHFQNFSEKTLLKLEDLLGELIMCGRLWRRNSGDINIKKEEISVPVFSSSPFRPIPVGFQWHCCLQRERQVQTTPVFLVRKIQLIHKKGVNEIMTTEVWEYCKSNSSQSTARIAKEGKNVFLPQISLGWWYSLLLSPLRSKPLETMNNYTLFSAAMQWKINQKECSASMP